jgi:hypothetical protein
MMKIACMNGLVTGGCGADAVCFRSATVHKSGQVTWLAHRK